MYKQFREYRQRSGLLVVLITLWCSALGVSPVGAEESSPGPLSLQIDQAFFTTQGKQLCLCLKGRAPQLLHGAILSLGISYAQKTFCWARSAPLSRPNRGKGLAFQMIVRHFTKAGRHALAGPYQLRLYCITSQQPTTVQQRLGTRIVAPVSRTLYWGTQAKFRQEDQVLKKFYAQRLVFARLLLDQLERQSNLALSVPFAKGPNPFAQETDENVWPRMFDRTKWEHWWRQEWGRHVASEKKALKTYQKKVVALRYPRMFFYLQMYYHLLVKYAALKTVSIYRFNQIAVPLRNKTPDIPLLAQKQAITKVLDNIWCLPLMAKLHDLLYKVAQCAWPQLGYARKPPVCEYYFPGPTLQTSGGGAATPSKHRQ